MFPIPADRAVEIAIKYKIDASLINVVFSLPGLGLIAQTIANNIPFFFNNFALPLAHIISNTLNIRLDITRVEFDATNRILTVYYAQDIAPVIWIAIAAFAGGLTIGVVFSGAIVEIFRTLAAAFVQYQLIDLAKQQQQAITNVYTECVRAGNPSDVCNEQAQTFARVLTTTTQPTLQAVQEISDLRREVDVLKTQRLAVGLGGAVAGLVAAELLRRAGR